MAFRTAGGGLVTPEAGERVTLDDVKRLVDIVFVVDTTGSMAHILRQLLQCIVTFVAQLAALNLDWRFSLVPFGDLTVHGDKVVGQLAFVSTVGEATKMIRQAPHFSGGANDGESSLEALQAALHKPFRPGAVKVIVLLTDEPPLTHDLNPQQLNRELGERQAICFVASPPKCGFEPLAREHGGKWYKISGSLNTADLLRFLQTLLTNVTQVSNDVHRLGGGDVNRYLTHPERRILS